MRLWTRARYSLRMMLAIAAASDSGEPSGTGEVARLTGISRSYLEQLVLPLQAAGLLEGRQGRRGGQVLARPAATIRVLDVFEGSGEDLSLVPCVTDPASCPRYHECVTRDLWTLLSRRIRGTLADFTLEDLLRPGEARARSGRGCRLRRPARRRAGRRDRG